MDKRDELKRTSNLVKLLLEEKPETRDSDMLLYIEVCKILNPESVKFPVEYVLLHLKEFGLPNTETVRRTRQKVQASFPELAGNRKVEKARAENENAFRQFARENLKNE